MSEYDQTRDNTCEAIADAMDSAAGQLAEAAARLCCDSAQRELVAWANAIRSYGETGRVAWPGLPPGPPAPPPWKGPRMVS